ncbi:MAG: alkyl sulfatase [Actinomycetota bacterium]|nr:alkyl sulfatase [Actinomycetota bacterium]
MANERTQTRGRLEVSPLTGTIGAELSAVDLSQDLDAETVADIRRALLENKVVFLRDQTLDYEGQVAFARRFGTLTLGHPTIQSPPDRPFLEEVDSAKGAPAADWHTDVTFLDQPVSFTFLRGVVIPEVGGDTVWANTVNAYETLSPELRELADTLRIVHTNVHPDTRIDGGRAESHPEWAESARQFASTVYRAEHPAVRVHPETGKRALLLGGFALRVVGYPSELSRTVIRTFQEAVTRPENTVRWHWRERDLAIWDNRSTQHCAIVDYGNAHRRCERVTVAGETPVGVDGRPGVSLRGDASTFYAGAA